VHVREVHLLIRQSGFRPKQIILVTTLLDPKRYPKAKLLSSIICAGKRRKSISSTSNHVKHGDDLGKITADGTKGIDASTGLQFAAKLEDIG